MNGWSDASVVPGRRADERYLEQLRVAERFKHATDLALLTFTLVATRE